MCRGGRGVLDGETGVQGGRFDRCNVARRPFVPLQTVYMVFIKRWKRRNVHEKGASFSFAFLLFWKSIQGRW